MIDNYNQNPNQLQYNAMNPNAMGNMQALQNVNGVQLDNTFNRVPTPQMNQQYAMPTTPAAIPQNVQTQITPNNNLQTY